MVDYKIWCTYHDKELLNKYNLKETDNFKLYYTKDLYIDGFSLNYVQYFLNEYVTQYYVWKNNIKSDLVGFCHYRRNINKYINNDILNHIYEYSQYKTFITIPINEIIINHHNYKTNLYSIKLDNDLFGMNLHYDLLLSYIKESYSNYIYERAIQLLNANYSRQNLGELYICKWNIFCLLIEFVNGYIKYMFNNLLNIPVKELHKYSYDEYNQLAKYLNDRNFGLRKDFIETLNINSDKLEFAGYPRSIGFIIESIIGIFWNLFINGDSYCNIENDEPIY